MKALILNSGLGSRMGEMTKRQPKCMTQLKGNETILSRQLKQLEQNGIREIVMTTGFFEPVLTEYCNSLGFNLQYTFVKNPDYDKTNYIYSIYLARKELEDDIILLHGDLVFQDSVLQKLIVCTKSCMAVSREVSLPEKDFKAVLIEEAGETKISKIGIEFFEHAVAAQPLYKLFYPDWKLWMNQIEVFCVTGQTSCYAEKAWNEISHLCQIVPLEIGIELCMEIDTIEDLEKIREVL